MYIHFTSGGLRDQLNPDTNSKSTQSIPGFMQTRYTDVRLTPDHFSIIEVADPSAVRGDFGSVYQSTRSSSRTLVVHVDVLKLVWAV